jgi:hypothetical protein
MINIIPLGGSPWGDGWEQVEEREEKTIVRKNKSSKLK